MTQTSTTEHFSEIALGKSPTAEQVTQIRDHLIRLGAFNFPTLNSGLFSAAASSQPELRATGYQNVWTRDNCHVAHALWATGQKELGLKPVRSLLQFYQKHQHKFLDIIEGRVSAEEPMNRPHIRFDGETLSELDVRWSHAQNDALGYLLWIASKMMRNGDLEQTPELIQLLRTFVQYLHAIRFWEDEDNGHWEEARKIEGSSIGTVVAGLMEFRQMLTERQVYFIDDVLLDDLISFGRRTLAEILPAECVQADPAKNRRYDAALLFLIFPLEVVNGEVAQQILNDVQQHLTGEIGIRRYNGDSYWCANYRELLSPEVRTSDFSDDMSSRDSLLQPGQEAQWCLFDPIASVIWGKRFQKSGDQADLDKQIHHMRRSLNHLTRGSERTPAHRFPESYFLENGEWVPNDICPLLWTQANVLLGLAELECSLRKDGKS